MRLQEAKQPDPTLHRNISFVKSALRIGAGVALMAVGLWAVGWFLVLAEVVGVVEELV